MTDAERSASGAEPGRAQGNTMGQCQVSTGQKTYAGFPPMQVRTVASDDIIVLGLLCHHSDSCFQGKVCS